MKILLLDNYDSFTYNLLHVVKELRATDIEVARNDQIDLDEVERFDKIILSPGPGIPEEAGLLLPVIKRYAPTKSILGVCLGHQAIGEAFGAHLENLKEVYHGVQTPISILQKEVLFEGLGKEIPVGRAFHRNIRCLRSQTHRQPCPYNQDLPRPAREPS